MLKRFIREVLFIEHLKVAVQSKKVKEKHSFLRAKLCALLTVLAEFGNERDLYRGHPASARPGSTDQGHLQGNIPVYRIL